MPISKTEMARKQVKAVKDNILAGTDIARSSFKLAQVNVKGRTAYAIECEHEHDLNTLMENAKDTYIVEQHSKRVMICSPSLRRLKSLRERCCEKTISI